MRALVTGATGMIGPALVNQLLADKWTVRILTRHEFDHELFRAPVEHIYGDIATYDTLLPAMRDVDVVFNLAAKLHLNNPSPNQSQAACIRRGPSQSTSTRTKRTPMWDPTPTTNYP